MFLTLVILVLTFVLLKWFWSSRLDQQKKTVAVVGHLDLVARESIKLFCDNGDSVFVLGNDENVLQELQTLHGDSIDTMILDYTDYEAIQFAAERVKERVGPKGLDVLVNNINTKLLSPMYQTSDFHLRRLLDTNFLSSFYLTKAFAPIMSQSSSCGKTDHTHATTNHISNNYSNNHAPGPVDSASLFGSISPPVCVPTATSSASSCVSSPCKSLISTPLCGTPRKSIVSSSKQLSFPYGGSIVNDSNISGISLPFSPHSKAMFTGDRDNESDRNRHNGNKDRMEMNANMNTNENGTEKILGRDANDCDDSDKENDTSGINLDHINITQSSVMNTTYTDALGESVCETPSKLKLRLGDLTSPLCSSSYLPSPRWLSPTPTKDGSSLRRRKRRGDSQMQKVKWTIDYTSQRRSIAEEGSLQDRDNYNSSCSTPIKRNTSTNNIYSTHFNAVNSCSTLNKTNQHHQTSASTHGPRIITISSQSGLRARLFHGVYQITQSAVKSLSEASQLELGKYGFTFINILPGFVNDSHQLKCIAASLNKYQNSIHWPQLEQLQKKLFAWSDGDSYTNDTFDFPSFSSSSSSSSSSSVSSTPSPSVSSSSSSLPSIPPSTTPASAATTHDEHSPSITTANDGTQAPDNEAATDLTLALVLNSIAFFSHSTVQKIFAMMIRCLRRCNHPIAPEAVAASVFQAAHAQAPCSSYSFYNLSFNFSVLEGITVSFAALVAFLASPALTKYAPQPVRESEAGKTVIEWLNCVAMSLDCTNPKTHADTDGENNNGSTGVDDEEKSDTDAGDECTSTDSENNSRGSNEKQWYHNQWRLNLNPDHWLGVDMLLSVLPEIVTRNI